MADDSKAGTISPWAQFDAWGASKLYDPILDHTENVLMKDPGRLHLSTDVRVLQPAGGSL